MQNKKNEKYIKFVVTVLIVIVLVWFLILSPLLKFKNMEKTLVNAAKRYFEVNANLLPTGDRLRKISLDTLYNKEFIKEDLHAPYTNTLCSSDSWVKVSKNKKDDTKYDYNVYLECGVFRSKIDHTGPTVKLNGEDEITIYLGDKYKEQGISSVTDDTDGNIDIKKVKIDSSKVNTNKTGTYEVTYEISDSLENKTIKKRIVNVIQTLNNIVKKGTDDNNYLKIDGILFNLVAVNSDKTVKAVSTDTLASLDYDSVDKWLNEYFYNKLSDSAKKYIIKSKWCSDKVNDPNNYSECKKYTKGKYVGLLSISDYKNVKNKNDETFSNNGDAVWTYSKKDNSNAWIKSYYDTSTDNFEEYKAFSTKTIVGIKPAINIKKDAIAISGEGTSIDPYILEGNNKRAKPGDKLSESVTGSYVKYSGYNFRVISKEEDGTVKVIMLDPLISNDGDFYTEFDTVKELYNPNKKTNIAYKIANNASEFIKIDYFDTKQIEVKQYTNVVSYDNKLATNKYKAKLSLASLFDLYSATKTDGVSTWYKESSNKENYINSASIGTVAMEFDKEKVAGIKLVGYLNKDVVIKTGKGTFTNPYTLTK